ncbi:MAG: hypothetical protein AUF79_03465 [Crenarchaeota archaeon 13_1_20CM_2_51_8]|nr:MAG: hypothetical protein AUF79_03465 [Crenarchaeota archaeon 13_1_20CM_2_51_8]
MNFVKIIPPTIAAAPNRVMFRVLYLCSIFNLDNSREENRDSLYEERYPYSCSAGLLGGFTPKILWDKLLVALE